MLIDFQICGAQHTKKKKIIYDQGKLFIIGFNCFLHYKCDNNDYKKKVGLYNNYILTGRGHVFIIVEYTKLCFCLRIS